MRCAIVNDHLVVPLLAVMAQKSDRTRRMIAVDVVRNLCFHDGQCFSLIELREVRGGGGGMWKSRSKGEKRPMHVNGRPVHVRGSGNGG